MTKHRTSLFIIIMANLRRLHCVDMYTGLHVLLQVVAHCHSHGSCFETLDEVTRNADCNLCLHVKVGLRGVFLLLNTEVRVSLYAHYNERNFT